MIGRHRPAALVLAPAPAAVLANGGPVAVPQVDLPDQAAGDLARRRIAWGDQGTLFDAKVQMALRAALPAAQYGQFDGRGHAPFREQPEKAGKTIADLLTGRPSP